MKDEPTEMEPTTHTPPWLDDLIESDWKQYERAGARLGRRARKWLIRWCRNFLTQNVALGWVRVEISESDDTFNVYLASITTDQDPDGEDGLCESAADDLFKWAAVVRYGVPNGSWVRVTRDGKVYRNKRKETGDED